MLLLPSFVIQGEELFILRRGMVQGYCTRVSLAACCICTHTRGIMCLFVKITTSTCCTSVGEYQGCLVIHHIRRMETRMAPVPASLFGAVVRVAAEALGDSHAAAHALPRGIDRRAGLACSSIERRHILHLDLDHVGVASVLATRGCRRQCRRCRSFYAAC